MAKTYSTQSTVDVAYAAIILGGAFHFDAVDGKETAETVLLCDGEPIARRKVYCEASVINPPAIKEWYTAVVDPAETFTDGMQGKRAMVAQALNASLIGAEQEFLGAVQVAHIAALREFLSSGWETYTVTDSSGAVVGLVAKDTNVVMDEDAIFELPGALVPCDLETWLNLWPALATAVTIMR